MLPESFQGLLHLQFNTIIFLFSLYLEALSQSAIERDGCEHDGEQEGHSHLHSCFHQQGVEFRLELQMFIPVGLSLKNGNFKGHIAHVILM